MFVKTYLPHDILKPYINMLVIHEMEDEQTYKVFPDTVLVIGFQYKGNLSYIDHHKEIALSASGITALRNDYRIFKNSKNIGTVLVLFKEAGAAHFFREPLNELFGESLPLDTFMLRSRLEQVEEKLASANSNHERINIVENFLISMMRPVAPDKLVMAALSLIHKTQGNISITDLANQLNISQSPLEKRFRKIVGTSPKKFATIARLKYVIQQYKQDKPIADVIYASGFYDQAHFIKNFKKFTGLTPEKYLRGKR